MRRPETKQSFTTADFRVCAVSTGLLQFTVGWTKVSHGLGPSMGWVGLGWVRLGQIF